LDEAFAFALELHASQRRKGSGVPYIAHLMLVSALVLEHGGTEDQAIGALLHDAVEDQGDRYEGGREGLRAAIRQRFGDVALRIVNDCTDDDGFEKGAAATAEAETESWRRRKQAYLDHLAAVDGPAALVSCADKVHNARSILGDYRREGDALWRRFRARTPENQLWYYGTLAGIFQKKGIGPLAEELTRIVNELRGLMGSAC
jgi:(p)ppGpp synthase/HD superfamily hydrolase